MTNDTTFETELLNEIFQTPSDTMRNQEIESNAACNGICNGGSCQG